MLILGTSFICFLLPHRAKPRLNSLMLQSDHDKPRMVGRAINTCAPEEDKGGGNAICVLVSFMIMHCISILGVILVIAVPIPIHATFTILISLDLQQFTVLALLLTQTHAFHNSIPFLLAFKERMMT